jgi:hypothetical protein
MPPSIMMLTPLRRIGLICVCMPTAVSDFRCVLLRLFFSPNEADNDVRTGLPETDGNGFADA